MDKKDSFEKRIAKIDEHLHTNQEKREQLFRRYEHRLNKYYVFSLLAGAKIQTMIFISIILFTNSFVRDIKDKIAISLVLCFLYNVIIMLLKRIFKPPKIYYQTLNAYNDEYSHLISFRNTYVFLHSYLLKGEDAILGNIKKRIEHQKYFDFNNCDKNDWLKNDVEVYPMFVEAYNLEKVMISDITNDVKNRLKYVSSADDEHLLKNILASLTKLEM